MWAESGDSELDDRLDIVVRQWQAWAYVSGQGILSLSASVFHL